MRRAPLDNTPPRESCGVAAHRPQIPRKRALPRDVPASLPPAGPGRPARSRNLPTSCAAVPAAGPGSPSPRTPRAMRPACAGARGCAPKSGMREMMHGRRAGRPGRRACPRRRCRGTAPDANGAFATSSATVFVMPPAPMPSQASALTSAPVPSPVHVPSPGLGLLPAPVPSPAPKLDPAPDCPRHHLRHRTPALPADRRRAAARPLPRGSG